jgi:hypothetical protein
VEEIHMNLVNRLLDLIKGTNLFTQELSECGETISLMAVVLGIRKTTFYVITLQSTI